jgi:uncharacterized protein YndB with AHSA1/START domain
MKTLEQSIDIDAPAEAVWMVISQARHAQVWGTAFMQDLKVEIDLSPGGDVIWQGKGMTVRGRVTRIDEGRLFEAVFPPELNPGMGNEMTETYAISERAQGSRLSISVGPVSEVIYNHMAGPWETALASIKAMAENESRSAAA